MSDAYRGYANAIFEIADAEGALERVTEDLFRFARALEQNRELATALSDISLPAERKLSVVHELLEGKASPHTTNAIAFLVMQHRIAEVGRISDELSTLASERSRKTVAEVRTAIELDDATKEKLTHALNQATGKLVDLRVVVDPSVVGGIWAKVGDQVIDSTVRRRLSDLRDLVAKE